MYFLLTIILVCICFTGDHILQISKTDLLRAVVDSATHGLIGIVSWLIVVLKCHKLSTMLISSVFELLCCGFLASAIDVDHFILSRSFKLKAAMSLGKKRPLLHCTTLPIVILVLSLAVGWIAEAPKVSRLGWLVWIAFFSHHIRDSSRRGMWLWPLGSSQPLPYYLYLTLTLALPYLVIIPLRYQSSSRMVQTYSTDYATV